MRTKGLENLFLMTGCLNSRDARKNETDTELKTQSSVIPSRVQPATERYTRIQNCARVHDDERHYPASEKKCEKTSQCFHDDLRCAVQL